MEIHHVKTQEVFQTLEALMKKTLDLGQSSLTEHQFRAFRKMVMDLFAEGRRSLLQARPYGEDIQDRCGESKNTVRRAVHHE